MKRARKVTRGFRYASEKVRTCNHYFMAFCVTIFNHGYVIISMTR